MKVQFYILGLLIRYGPQHGYRLKQIIQTQISDFAQIKLPNIYYHLEKMNHDGYVSAESEKDGNRPEKTVFSVTEKGKRFFQNLLKEMMKDDLNFEFPMDGVIYFRDYVSEQEFEAAVDHSIQACREKLNSIMTHHEETLKIISPAAWKETNAIFDHHIYHVKAELDWLLELKKGLVK